MRHIATFSGSCRCGCPALPRRRSSPERRVVITDVRPTHPDEHRPARRPRRPRSVGCVDDVLTTVAYASTRPTGRRGRPVGASPLRPRSSDADGEVRVEHGVLVASAAPASASAGGLALSPPAPARSRSRRHCGCSQFRPTLQPCCRTCRTTATSATDAPISLPHTRRVRCFGLRLVEPSRIDHDVFLLKLSRGGGAPYVAESTSPPQGHREQFQRTPRGSRSPVGRCSVDLFAPFRPCRCRFPTVRRRSGTGRGRRPCARPEPPGPGRSPRTSASWRSGPGPPGRG